MLFLSPVYCIWRRLNVDWCIHTEASLSGSGDWDAIFIITALVNFNHWLLSYRYG